MQGESIKTIAKKTGVSQSTIYKSLRGHEEGNVKIDTALKLCAAFGLNAVIKKRPPVQTKYKYKTCSVFIFEALVKKKLTVARAAYRLKISRARMRRYMDHDAEITPATAERLRNFFGAGAVQLVKVQGGD